MYNKLFTKILDSSIWLESASTRLVWLTMIAAMDETGFAQFASIQNLAHRARVPIKEVDKAIECLQGPDPNSSDPENEGRRIERVPGGWMILNAEKYRDMVTRAVILEKTRIRVAKHRAVKKGTTPSNADVTAEALHVTNVTPSGAVAETKAEEEGKPPLFEFSKLVRNIRPDVPDHFIRDKYFGKLDRADGVIRNPQFFAAQVAGWHQEAEAKAAGPPKNDNGGVPSNIRMV